MNRKDSQPVDKNFLCSNHLEDQIPYSKDIVPIFLLPYGFHTLSLFQIAQYYDGSASNFYQNIIFSNCSTNGSDACSRNFSQYKIFDYSLFFSQIIHNFLIPKSVQPSQYIKLSDRYFDIDILLSLPPLGDSSFISYHIPKGNEDGITYILSQSREFLRPHLFSLMSVPFSSLPAQVTITSGQPFLFNKILSSTYSNIDSINSRKESLINEINNLKHFEFLIDWAIVSFNGFASLILVRPPQFLRISDRNLDLFDSIDKVFENSNVYLVCYRHSQFINKANFEIPKKTSKIDRPISSDSFFCNLLKDEMKRIFDESDSLDFESFLIYSLRYPSFYLMNCGFEKEVALAASVFIDDPKGRAAPLFIPLLKSLIKNDEKESEKNSYPEGNAPAPASTPFDDNSTYDQQNIFNDNQYESQINNVNEDSNNNNSDSIGSNNSNTNNNNVKDHEENNNKDDIINNDDKKIQNNNKEINSVTNNNDENNDNIPNDIKIINSENDAEIKTNIDNSANNNNNDINEINDQNDANDINNDKDDINMSSIIVSPFQDKVEVESKLLSNQISQLKASVHEYYKFTFWLRSFISVIKSIRKRDLYGIIDTSLSCFRSLPIRNKRVMISTILLLTESLRIFRKQRSQNDEFFLRILRIFKSIFGEEFDHVLGLQKWEVPRDMRRQVVSIDSCVKMFYIRSFQTEVVSINNAIYRLKKYLGPVMKEISFDQEVPSFKLCQSYIDFLKLQKFEKIIET